MRPEFYQFDNLDDRREIHQLLGRLPPADRWRFVAWLCTLVELPKTGRSPVLTLTERDHDMIKAATVRGDERADLAITNQAWGFVWQLCWTWGLSADLASGTLVDIVRGRKTLHGLRKCTSRASSQKIN